MSNENLRKIIEDPNHKASQLPRLPSHKRNDPDFARNVEKAAREAETLSYEMASFIRDMYGPDVPVEELLKPKNESSEETMPKNNKHSEEVLNAAIALSFVSGIIIGGFITALAVWLMP